MKVLDSSVLRVHWLLRRRPMVELSRITSEREHLEILKETFSGKSIGIYVHIPFCKSICMFCPYFKQVLRNREELNTYLEAVTGLKCFVNSCILLGVMVYAGPLQNL